MPSFLSLPPEIRCQIYRELRSFNSPLIRSPCGDEIGYCSFGFHSRILETSRQLSYEAKQVLYGENNWTFFASHRKHFCSDIFRIQPMALILPFVKRAHIRFAMFHWLLWASHGLMSKDGEMIQNNVKEICLVLLTAPALRTVKIIWTETCYTCPMRTPLILNSVNSVHSLISDILRPLRTLPTTSELQKSNIRVVDRNGVKLTKMEHDFSECVDEVIVFHRSRKVF